MQPTTRLPGPHSTAELARIATAGAVVLLHPPLTLVGGSIAQEKGCQHFHSIGMSSRSGGTSEGSSPLPFSDFLVTLLLTHGCTHPACTHMLQFHTCSAPSPPITPTAHT